jgi:hypothetical protein
MSKRSCLLLFTSALQEKVIAAFQWIEAQLLLAFPLTTEQGAFSDKSDKEKARRSNDTAAKAM